MVNVLEKLEGDLAMRDGRLVRNRVKYTMESKPTG